MKFQVQTYLPYILQTVVYTHTITNLPSSSYEANILLPYYIILFVPKPSITFSISYNCMICDCDIHDHFVTSVTPPLCLVIYITITIIYDILLQTLSKSKNK